MFNNENPEYNFVQVVIDRQLQEPYAICCLAHPIDYPSADIPMEDELEEIPSVDPSNVIPYSERFKYYDMTVKSIDGCCLDADCLFESHSVENDIISFGDNIEISDFRYVDF